MQALDLVASRATVLVAEDDVELALVLRESLEELGYDVRVAHDGEVALGVMRQADPAVLIVDLGLAADDGMSVVRRVRGFEREPCAIVGITGQRGPDLQERARAAGCDLLLLKPFGVDELREALDHARTAR